jgi:hypothetical protein
MILFATYQKSSFATRHPIGCGGLANYLLSSSPKGYRRTGEQLVIRKLRGCGECCFPVFRRSETEGSKTAKRKTPPLAQLI